MYGQRGVQQCLQQTRIQLSTHAAAAAANLLPAVRSTTAYANATSSRSRSDASAYSTAAAPTMAIAASSSYSLASIRRLTSPSPHTHSSASTSSHCPTHGYSTSTILHRSNTTPIPPRTARHDNEWDVIRKSKDPFITTLDPQTPFPKLAPNDLEINKLSFKFGLPPLPSLSDRIRQYKVEQSYYDRRDARIRDHLDRLLRMKKLSKKEMLILIDQVEQSFWNLPELQKAYLPEVRHAEQEEEDKHRRALRVGAGGAHYVAEYRKRKAEKLKKYKENGPQPRKHGDDGMPKYGYRKDLANFGPEFWDYLTPYLIFEPEARHLSHLDGAFKYEDRYVLWEEERRKVALGAKLQRMKMLGIPLEQADTLATPDMLPRDHLFPTAQIRRALQRYLKKGGSEEDRAFWRQWHDKAKPSDLNEKLLRTKEAKTITAARRNIPEYIKRFERERDMDSVDVTSQVVLAQNVYLKQQIEEERKKPSLLTKQQQESAKALLGMMAQRNRLALKKMYLSTRTIWENLMVERALEKKYLETYQTVGSDHLDNKTLIKLEQEVMEVVKDYQEKFTEHDWQQDALNLRDLRRAQQQERHTYTLEYAKKMEEIQAKNAADADPNAPDRGDRGWIDEMLKWQEESPKQAEEQAKQEQLKSEVAALDHELDTWSEFWEVQVAIELGHMLDSGELINEDRIDEGAIALAEKRVSKRLHATKQEWKSWKLRPQYTRVEDMYAPPADPIHAMAIADTAVTETKSDGKRIVEHVIKQDSLLEASHKWKARMQPKLDELDRYENEELPNTVVSQLDSQGKFSPVPDVPSGTASGVDGSTSNAVGDYDPSLSTSGHRFLDASNPADRRAMIDHASKSEIKDETLRGEAEDPMLALLNEHYRHNSDGRQTGNSARAAGVDDDGDGKSSDPSTRNQFSTVNPRLGFEDDDFRLYDPVLMKTRGPKRDDKSGNTYNENETLTSSLKKKYNNLKKHGQDILGDDETDPVYWIKDQDRKHRVKHFLDLDPFGPPNTDERRDFDDQYLHLDEEDYAYKTRVDPETEHQKPLTQQIRLGMFKKPYILKYGLNDETQELLYTLHRSDPVKHTPRALAHKFQLSADRVKSALIVQAIHHRMMANGFVHPMMMNYDEERALEDVIRPTMGWIHSPPELDYQFLPDYRWVREDDLHRVLAEEKSIEDRFLSRGERLDKAEQVYYAKWGAIGTEPPAEPKVQPLLDERLMSPTKSTLAFIDTSEIPAARYAIAIRHRDGTLREPNEEVYQWIRKREKGTNHFVYVKYHKEEVPM